MKKRLFFLGLFALAIVGGGLSLAFLPDKKIPSAPKVAQDSIIKANLSFVGDLMCHSEQFQYAKLAVAPDSFNFMPCFEQIEPYTQWPDMLVGNLETTLSSSKAVYSGYPQFNTPDEYLDAVKHAGFDFIVNSNNHSMDKGEAGLLRTLDMLDKLHIPHTGTYRSQKDRDSIRVMDLKGIKISFLNYTYGTNGLPLPVGKPWSLNLIDTTLIRNDVAAARKISDLVVVFYHYGNEYERQPGEYQKMCVQKAIDCGADIIIGAHPHVVQPMNVFKTKNARLDTGFVAYSLGNFLSHQAARYTDSGVMLNLEISRNTKNDSIWISNVSFVPTWVYRAANPAKKIHVIFPSQKSELGMLPPFIGADQKIKIDVAYSDVKSHVPSYRSSIKMKDLREYPVVAVDSVGSR